MKEYFTLLLEMTNRKIKEAGLNPVLAYLLGIITFCLLLEFIFYKTEYAKYLTIFICLIFQLSFAEKNRTDFLLTTFGDKTKNKIRIIENLMLCFPFVLFLLFKNCFLESIILLILSVISALSSHRSDLSFTIPTPFSKRPFEFSTGFRKTIFIILFAYALTIIAISVDNFNLGIFSFLLIFLVSLTYYGQLEQMFYVWIHAESPKVFLKNKILNASKNASLLVLPILISLLLFYPSQYLLILLFFLLGHLFLWTIILAKYSEYPSEMNILGAIMISSCLAFPPMLLAIIPFFYTKSIQKLNIILND